MLKNSFEKQVNSLKSTKYPDFDSKLRKLLADNQVVVDIVDFNDDVIGEAKYLRNCFAHGETVLGKDRPKDLGDYDITYEYKVYCKVRVLLYALAYKALGFADEEIAKSFAVSRHQALEYADLNKYHLAKYGKTHIFLDVDESDFERIEAAGKYADIVLSYSESGGYRYREDISTAICKPWINGRIIESIAASSNADAHRKISGTHFVYVECKDRYFECRQAVLVDSFVEVAPFLCLVRDDSSGEWLQPM